MAEGEVSAAEQSAGEAPVDVSELKGLGSQSAYEAFLAEARALEPGFIEECCADIVLAYEHVTRAVEQILGSGAVNVAKLPGVNVMELSMLPRLVQGLAFAALQVERELKAASFGALFARAQPMRRRLRKAADALAEAQLLAEQDIDEVWLHGQQDVVEDCQALVALLRRNAPRIAGRSPVTPSELDDAEQLVGTLRMALGRQGAVKEEGEALFRALEMRDRFWTLLTQRYDLLWRCGAWLYGRAASERIPPLPVRPSVMRRHRAMPVEPEAPRMEQALARRQSPTPTALVPLTPVRSPTAREQSRHLADLQRDMERKMRFLVRLGAVSPPRR